MAKQAFIVEHEHYEKLVDDMQFLGFNTVLRMNVALAKKLDDGRRMSYHNEYMYSTDKYIDTDRAITLRRSFNYYMSIESIRPIDGQAKAFVMLKEQDIFFIKKEFREVFNWFFSMEAKYKNIFAKNANNKLIVFNKPDPILIPIITLNSYLLLEPTVLEYDNGERHEAVRMFLGNDYQYVDIRREKFIALYEILSNINLFQCAQAMLNYLGRPDNGTNLKAFDNNSMILDDGDVPKPKIPDKREVPGKKNPKSFFDKIDDM